MPVVPSSLLEPLWIQFAALLPGQPEFAPDHPWGCHRRRIADRVVFEHVIAALMHGSGYERIASTACSATTIRRRVRLWNSLGAGPRTAPDHPGRLRPDDRAGTRRPGRRRLPHQSPVQRRQGRPVPGRPRQAGLKRSTCVQAKGVPLDFAAAGANRHDSKLLDPTLRAAREQVGGLPEDATVHLDSAYNGKPCQAVHTEHALIGEIAAKGVPAPIQVGKRWVVESTQSRMNGYGKIRRCFERDGRIVDFYLYLAAAFVTVRAPIPEARTRYRWDTRPTTHRLH